MLIISVYGFEMVTHCKLSVCKKIYRVQQVNIVNQKKMRVWAKMKQINICIVIFNQKNMRDWAEMKQINMCKLM